MGGVPLGKKKNIWILQDLLENITLIQYDCRVGAVKPSITALD